MVNRIQLIVSALDNTKGAFQGLDNSFKNLSGKIAIISAKFAAIAYAARSAFQMITNTIAPAYNAVEDFNMSVLKMSAMITSSLAEPSGNLADDYKLSKEYAEALVAKLEEMDAKTIASARDLGLINEELVKQGVLFDINNEKQEQGFINIANAVAVIAQGSAAKEIQLRQEARALMQGQVSAASQLASQINALVGGSLKQKVELWKKEGTLIENIGELLKGYAAASEDIEGTWAAIGSTMESIINKILRGGFTEIYKTINDFLKQINEYLKEHMDKISTGMRQGWLSIKGLVESVYNLLKPFTPILSLVGGLVGIIVRGLGLIAYTILPPLAERIGKILDSVFQWVLLTANLASALWKLLKLDFKGAAEDANAAKKNFKQAGSSLGEAFSGGFGDEVVKRFAEFDKKMVGKKGAIEAPKLRSPRGEDDKKAAADKAKKLKEDIASFRKEIEYMDSDIDKTSESILKLWDRAEKLINAGGNRKEITDLFMQGVGFIHAEADKKAAEEAVKLGQERADKLAEFEKQLTEAKQTEIQKRISVEQEFVNEQERRLIAAGVEYEARQQRMVEIRAIAAKKMQDIEMEHLATVKEARLRYELSEVDAAEKARTLTKEQAIRQRIDLEQKLLSIGEQRLSRLNPDKDAAAYYAQADAVQKLRSNILTLNEALKEQTGTLQEGLTEGIKRYINVLTTEFQKGLSIVRDVTQAMEGAFMNFFDVTSKGFMKFHELARSILNDIYKALLRTLIVQPLVGAITRGIGNIIGKGTVGTTIGIDAIGNTANIGHKGGLVTQYGIIPKFHSGGEVPAILQSGEYVVSRRGVAALDAINQGRVSTQPDVNVVVNVQNNTGMPVQAREGSVRFNGKQMVKEIILELKRTDPAFNAEMARGY